MSTNHRPMPDTVPPASRTSRLDREMARTGSGTSGMQRLSSAMVPRAVAATAMYTNARTSGAWRW